MTYGRSFVTGWLVLLGRPGSHVRIPAPVALRHPRDPCDKKACSAIEVTIFWLARAPAAERPAHLQRSACTRAARHRDVYDA